MPTETETEYVNAMLSWLRSGTMSLMAAMPAARRQHGPAVVVAPRGRLHDSRAAASTATRQQVVRAASSGQRRNAEEAADTRRGPRGDAHMTQARSPRKTDARRGSCRRQGTSKNQGWRVSSKLNDSLLVFPGRRRRAQAQRQTCKPNKAQRSLRHRKQGNKLSLTCEHSRARCENDHIRETPLRIQSDVQPNHNRVHRDAEL